MGVATGTGVAGEVGAGLLGGGQSEPNINRKHATASNPKNKVNSRGHMGSESGKLEPGGGGNVGSEKCSKVVIQPSKTSIASLQVMSLAK